MAGRLLLLNGIAILNVIVFHATQWGLTAMFSENWVARYASVRPGGYDPFAYGALRGIEQFVSFTIAAFIFVSGFFIAFTAGRKVTVERTVIYQRLKYLIVPYVLWTVIIWISLALQGRVFDFGGYGLQLLTGTTDPSYYFVPLLAQLYLLSPVIVPLAKRHWKPLLAILAFFQLAVYAAHYPALLGIQLPAAELFARFTPKWFFPARLFWFAFGMVVGFHISALKPAIERLRWVWLAGAAMLLVAGVFEWEALSRRTGAMLQTQETFVDGLYSFCVILAFLAFGKVRFPFADRLNMLGSRSFGIYLVHSPVMQYASRGLYHLAPWVLAYQVLLQPVLIVLGLGLPLLLMFAVKRSPVRAYYAYQFG